MKKRVVETASISSSHLVFSFTTKEDCVETFRRSFFGLLPVNKEMSSMASAEDAESAFMRGSWSRSDQRRSSQTQWSQ